MKKYLGLIALLLGSLSLLAVAFKKPKVQEKLPLEEQAAKPIESKVLPKTVESKAEPEQPKEDPDILDFSRSLAKSLLSEKDALDFLSGNISQNKKSVVIETYNEKKGKYTSRIWGSILLHMISDSDEWPELANRAADSLLATNSEGQLDSEILDLMNSLSPEEVVKRCALAFALVKQSSIEAALQQAVNREEIELLTGKEANFLSQEERLERFSNPSDEYQRVLYLDAFIRNAKSQEELLKGLRKGIQDEALSSEEKPRFILAASESSIPGKSKALFDYWKSLLPRSKELKDYLSILNIAVQKAAFSENGPQHARSIFENLLGQKGLKASDTDDPRIDLSIAMVNACSDPLIVKSLCAELMESREQLKSKLVAEGLASYLNP